MTTKYGVNDLRRMFLEFFESKEHLRLRSFSLVPQNDKSLLLINAGMAPLKPYFTGQEVPPSRRICTCQKCVRTNDIEHVGKTARHLTFFEMLGNFSFGDYFKKEAIEWSWEFLTQTIGLEADRLYPSIYFEDEEAFQIWTDVIGIEPERITRFYRDADGKCDNFWEHGAGPCGPCSEIYYDRGEKYGCGDPNCKVGCECDRFMEVWNNVFTQFEGDGKGNYTLLEQKNIDTGMGLERLAIVVQDVDTIFDIDTMCAIRDRICDIAKTSYHVDAKKDESIRLITDHIRSSTFLIADGVMPSNEGRGYVLRRLIRRAARHGRLLGIEDAFLSTLCQTVIEQSSDGYPELEDKKEFIIKVFTQEEEKFDKTIDQGLVILSQMITAMKETNKQVFSGEEAFRLYDTYGFPIDLTREIIEEDGFQMDEEGFINAMNVQKQMAKAARKQTNYMGADATVYESLPVQMTSEFVGYGQMNAEGKILAITSESSIVDSLDEGESGTLITDLTPFYATSGGQASDIGTIRTQSGEFEVHDTMKLQGGKIGHIGVVTDGTILVNEAASLSVDVDNRQNTQKNHSATHLLQKALRQVLGTHVEQSGSDVNGDRLRFDFTHFTAMTREELDRVQELVNQAVEAALEVRTDVMSIDEARKSGAMALFGEKYGDEVRVVRMGDYSIELCGGTHVSNTSQIQYFKILSESGVAAGVRRIEALTAKGAFRYMNQMEERLNQVAGLMKATNLQVIDKTEQLLEHNKKLSNELEAIKQKTARDSAGDFLKNVIQINEISILTSEIENLDMNGLRDLGDSMKDQMGESIVVLVSNQDGKVNLIAMATEGAVKKGGHAGNLIKEIAGCVGGGGGGRPNMAQAGGKNPNGMKEALEKAVEVVKKQLM
ncbi:MAG: alanine--tRNA ligase [Lachnospiraceae bacterium]|nr:alanine--tRNA ligase [Lachnospiraceae bacterium]